MNSVPIEQTKDGIQIQIHLQPGAKKNALCGIHGKAIKIQLQAQPVEGKANKAAIQFLSKKLSVAKNKIELKTGQKSREKIFIIRDIKIETVKQKLLEKDQ